MMPEKSIVLYKYNPKTVSEHPVKMCSVSVNSGVKFVQMLPEGFILLCYCEGVSIYQVDEVNGVMRSHLNKKF